LTPSRYSTTHCGKSERTKTILAVVFLLAVIAAWIITLSTEQQPKGHDTEHPMPNAHTSWLQTYYVGDGNGF